jgi:hypothetical protein
MRLPDYNRTRFEITSRDLRATKPWLLTSDEYVTYLNGIATPGGVINCLVRARSIRLEAESYRAFNIGVCGLIFRNGGMSQHLAHGANMKSGPGKSEVDEHGEDFITNILQPGDTLSILTVVAPNQPDSSSAKESPTLHPCYKCRRKIKDLGEISAKTLIVTALPDITAVQWGGIEDYINAHTVDDFEPATAYFEETPELFRLPDVSPGKPIHLTPDLDIDTSEWDRKVSFPIWEWIKSNQVTNTV